MAIVTTQVIFGAGTILAGNGFVKHPINPILFQLVREILSCICLLLLSTWWERTLPEKRHVPRLVMVRIDTVLISQYGYIYI